MTSLNSLTGWRALWVRNPWTMRFVWGIAVLIFAGDLFLVTKRVVYARETTRLRDGMSGVEKTRIDAGMQNDANRLLVMIELARRQARVDNTLNLAIALDSAALYLEQDGAILRAVHADIGPDTWERRSTKDSVQITAPRGTRTIERLVGDTVVMLNGGALIYARSAADSGAARAGTVRVEAADLKVLMPSLKAGQRVYFY
jgi:hypothetical protein